MADSATSSIDADDSTYDDNYDSISNSVEGNCKILNTVQVGDPTAYRLVCLDSTLIPESHNAKDLNTTEDFEPVKQWMKKDVIESIENEDRSKQWYSLHQKLDEQDYFIVSLYVKPSISAAAQLTRRLQPLVECQNESDKPFHDKSAIDNAFVYRASVILFPQSRDKALAYLFGNWKQIVNPYAIAADWGLQLAASETICSASHIKRTLEKSFNHNPTTIRESKQCLAHIDSFDLNIGTELLCSLTLRPSQPPGTCRRLVTGTDSYYFHLYEGKVNGKESTISTLYHMARYLYEVPLNIHPKLQAYIDEEEKDKETLDILNRRLEEILCSSDASIYCFPAHVIWHHYGKTPLFSFGNNRDMKDLLSSLKDQNPTLKSLVSIKPKKREMSEEPLGRIIFSLPIEAKEKFYRFYRGRWFKVRSSRIEAIITKLRSSDIKTTMDELLPYTEEDARGSKENDAKGGINNKKSYQELRYNQRIIKSLLAGKQKRIGILLDRINIQLDGTKNQFEFGDMLIHDRPNKEGHYYIIHVKRGTRDIDHHRTQVERCSEFLATELNKKNAKTLLLQGFVNSLYLKHNVEIGKVAKQGKRITHASYFKEVFASSKDKEKRNWKNFIKNKVLNINQGEAATPIENLKTILKPYVDADLKNFEDYQNELIVALDAMYDCIHAKQTSFTSQHAEEILNGVMQVIQFEVVLFSNGIIPENIRRQITLVMAVVDDRQIKKVMKAEEELKLVKDAKTPCQADIKNAEAKLQAIKNTDRSKENELFNMQQIWGLDNTVKLVCQKHGFKFNLVVINENCDRSDWDAFGSTQTENTNSSQEDTDDTDVVPKKKTAACKRSLKSNSKSAERKIKKLKRSGDKSDSNNQSEVPATNQNKITKYFPMSPGKPAH